MNRVRATACQIYLAGFSFEMQSGPWVKIRDRVRVRFAFCSFGFSFTEHRVRVRVMELSPCFPTWQ